MDPLRLLQEDLKESDHEDGLHCIRRIGTIASALGPDRTRDELMPFLFEYCEEDNDEALSAVATCLGEFADRVGGGDHVACLLPLLEKLAQEEEYVVRNAAIKALAKLVPSFPKEALNSKFVPLLKRLSNGDWFTARVSACGIFAPCYPHVPETTQEELRSLFSILCKDDTPMVRKAVYSHLGDFAVTVQKEYFTSDVLPLLKMVAEDDVETMRVYLIDCVVLLTKHLSSSLIQSHVQPFLDGLQDDSSWRVRKALCENCVQISENLGDDAAKSVLPLYAKLLVDKEPEVRTAAAKQLGPMCGLTKSGLMEHVAPCLSQLSTDPSQNVRAELAKSVGPMFPSFGKENGPKVLVPLIQTLSQDEAFEVRNRILEDVECIAEALGVAGVTASLLPAMIELCKDIKWRVRKSVVLKIGVLARVLGVKVFEKKLQQFLIDSLSDHFFDLREACCEQIGEIVKEFGAKWAAEKLFPAAFQIYDKNTNYLHRMTCLHIIRNCAPVCSADVIEKHFLSLIIQAMSDDVPNVRLVAAKVLISLIPLLDKDTVNSKLVKQLQTMAKETDPDVVYFSTQALALV